MVIWLPQPEVAALGALALASLAEWIHARRTRRIARLAFGPTKRPRVFAMTAPVLRVVAASLLAYGLVTLLALAPKKHTPGEDRKAADVEHRHVLLVLDVSPSMRLEDAGPELDRSRMARARDVMESFLRRIPIEYYRVSVVAVYSDAKPVVIDTRDIDVVRNILGDLPMHYAFRTGKTRLFKGLEEAARIARPWNPKSTTLVLVSDGDTVPAKGMPRMPASIDQVLVVGVGDPVTGKFIDGRQSRQDTSTLRQIAVRLGGTYTNANEHHLATTLIEDLTRLRSLESRLVLTRREYALLACALGAAILALLPWLLHRFGTAWTPGVPVRVRRRRDSMESAASDRRAAWRSERIRRPAANRGRGVPSTGRST